MTSCTAVAGIVCGVVGDGELAWELAWVRAKDESKKSDMAILYIFRDLVPDTFEGCRVYANLGIPCPLFDEVLCPFDPYGQNLTQ